MSSSEDIPTSIEAFSPGTDVIGGPNATEQPVTDQHIRYTPRQRNPGERWRSNSLGLDATQDIPQRPASCVPAFGSPLTPAIPVAEPGVMAMPDTAINMARQPWDPEACKNAELSGRVQYHECPCRKCSNASRSIHLDRISLGRMSKEEVRKIVVALFHKYGTILAIRLYDDNWKRMVTSGQVRFTEESSAVAAVEAVGNGGFFHVAPLGRLRVTFPYYSRFCVAVGKPGNGRPVPGGPSSAAGPAEPARARPYAAGVEAAMDTQVVARSKPKNDSRRLPSSWMNPRAGAWYPPGDNTMTPRSLSGMSSSMPTVVPTQANNHDAEMPGEGELGSQTVMWRPERSGLRLPSPWVNEDVASKGNGVRDAVPYSPSYRVPLRLSSIKSTETPFPDPSQRHNKRKPKNRPKMSARQQQDVWRAKGQPVAQASRLSLRPAAQPFHLSAPLIHRPQAFEGQLPPLQLSPSAVREAWSRGAPEHSFQDARWTTGIAAALPSLANGPAPFAATPSPTYPTHGSSFRGANGLSARRSSRRTASYHSGLVSSPADPGYTSSSGGGPGPGYDLSYLDNGTGLRNPYYNAWQGHSRTAHVFRSPANPTDGFASADSRGLTNTWNPSWNTSGDGGSLGYPPQAYCINCSSNRYSNGWYGLSAGSGGPISAQAPSYAFQPSAPYAEYSDNLYAHNEHNIGQGSSSQPVSHNMRLGIPHPDYDGRDPSGAWSDRTYLALNHSSDVSEPGMPASQCSAGTAIPTSLGDNRRFQALQTNDAMRTLDYSSSAPLGHRGALATRLDSGKNMDNDSQALVLSSTANAVPRGSDRFRALRSDPRNNMQQVRVRRLPPPTVHDSSALHSDNDEEHTPDTSTPGQVPLSHAQSRYGGSTTAPARLNTRGLDANNDSPSGMSAPTHSSATASRYGSSPTRSDRLNSLRPEGNGNGRPRHGPLPAHATTSRATRSAAADTERTGSRGASRPDFWASTTAVRGSPPPEDSRAAED